MFEGKDVTVLLANAGSGKAGWVEAIIPTPQGNRRFGDLKVGDYVFDRLGNPTKVLGVYPRGLMDAYKVTLADGRSTICGLDHLWTVYKGTYSHKALTLELSEMLEEGIRKQSKREGRNSGSARFYVPAHGCRQYESKEVSVSPYAYGAFLGNGCLTSKYLEFSSDDAETVAKVASCLGLDYHKRSAFNYTWDFTDNGKRVETNRFFDSLYAHEKFIADEYKYNSREVRLAVLQGLFDTDGSARFDGKRLHVSYSTVSKRLCDDVVELLESLGIVATVRKDIREGRRLCYEVRVNSSREMKEILFTLTRKKDRCINACEARHNYTRVAIRKVEKLEKQLELQCIYVDNEEHLYQCEHGIVTHNTTKLMDILLEELKTKRPEEIAFVTFTKKGATEGLTRACSKFNLTADELPYFRTLHSLTFHALNLDRKSIFTKLDERKFNKETGYYLNRCDNVSLVHASKDSKYLDFYDLERSGAVNSKQLAEADIEIGYYRQLVQKYEEYKSRQHLVDFFDCLIKYVQVGDPLPCKTVMVDECQDISALQWQVIERAFAKADKIYIAGDENQCQPAGSKVLTKCGYKNIEDVTSEDSLITFAQNDCCYYGMRTSEYHPEIAHRYFSGELIDVRLDNGTVNKFTPNHKMIVRWLNRDTSLQCVYLMKRGEWYRVGQCQVFNSAGATHFIARMNVEKAEEGWILKVCKTKEEALVYEQIYSSISGIPQVSWNKWYTHKMQDKVYEELGSLEDKAKSLLASVGRDIEYPMFNHEKNNAKSGGTCISLCEAINLIPEIMCVPVFEGKSHANKATLWHSFSTSKEQFSGLVYSMNVPKHHTYITDGGLTVHNCIFRYAGARPDILIDLANKYPRIELKSSYRLPKKVYGLAKGIINMVQEKTDKAFDFREGNTEGNIHQLSDLDRLKNFIDTDNLHDSPRCQWYLLARNNCYLAKYTHLLEDNLIPYWNSDGFFMGGDIMRRIKDYNGFSLEGYKSEAKREQFRNKYGITDFSVPFYETNLFTEGRKWVYASYIEKYGLARLEEMCKWNPQILVSTIHYVKGGEADNVAIMLDSTSKTYSEVFEDIDTELRVLYVGVTRARENLFLIDSKSKFGYDNIISIVKEENGLQF